MVALAPRRRLRSRRAPSTQGVAELELARDLGAGLLAHQRLEARASSPSAASGKAREQHLGDDQAEHAVAEELQPLVVPARAAMPAATALEWVSAVVEQVAVGEAMAEPRLSADGRLRRVAAHARA